MSAEGASITSSNLVYILESQWVFHDKLFLVQSVVSFWYGMHGSAFAAESTEWSAMAVLRRQVYDELKKLILSGVLRPGERLHERDLTKQLGVSRTPLRVAMNQLASDGLVI